MATHDNSTSRRALILGLAGTPFLAGTIAATISTGAEASPSSRKAWDQAFAAHAQAEEASRAFDAKHKDQLRRAWAEQDAATAGKPGSEWRAIADEVRTRHGTGWIEDQCEANGEATCAAASTLLKTPAPDAEALMWKLDHLFGEGEARDEGGWSASWCPEFVDAFMADARRLLSHGRA